MDNTKYISRVSVVVNKYSLDEDDYIIEEDFQDSVNYAIEKIEEVGAEVMVINFETKVTDTDLFKFADIEYSMSEDCLSKTEAEARVKLDKTPTLDSLPKKITQEAFTFIQLKSEEGLEISEIKELFEDSDQKISSFTIRKIINTLTFEDYYVKK